MSDEKQILGQAPEQADPKHKETLLLYDESNHAVQAVSDLKHSGNDYQVITTQSLSENAPALFQLKDSPAAAAFIAGFKSQKDKDNFRFLRVAADKVGEVVQAQYNLTNNPKDEDDLKALREHTVTSYQLDKVKVRHPRPASAGVAADGHHRLAAGVGGNEARTADQRDPRSELQAR